MTHQNHQRGRTLQESDTALSIDAVLVAARTFFSAQSGVYSAFIERQGPSHIVLRGQGGEELVIAARTDNGVTKVTGSSYLFDQQVARFISSLPPAPSTESAA